MISSQMAHCAVAKEKSCRAWPTHTPRSSTSLKRPPIATNLQAAADVRVRVDHIRNAADQLDNHLGHVIAWSRLATDNDCARREVCTWVAL